MRNGLYVARITSGAAVASGVVVIQDGRLLGGDAGFTYVGRVTTSDGLVRAHIDISNYNPAERSIFGQLPALSVEASDAGSGGRLTGTVVGNPDMAIEIELRWVAA